jgi:ATP-binding cassette subfamily B protein
MPTDLSSYRRLLAHYLRPLWLPAAGLALALLASISLELLNPYLLSQFIDTALAGAEVAALLRLALLFLVVAVALQGTRVVESYLAAHVGLSATNQLRSDLALHVLNLDMPFHNARTPGELIERVDGDVATLGNFFARFVVQLLGNGLLLVGVLILLAGIDWRVGLALTVFVTVSIAAVNRLRSLAVPFWKRARESSAALFGFIEERLAFTEDARANGAVAYVLRGLAVRSRDRMRLHLLAETVGVASGTVTIILLAAGTAVGLGLGAVLYGQGALSLGAVYLIFAYSQLLSRPIEQLSRQFQDLQQAGAGLARIRELLGERSLIEPGTRTLPSGPLAVEFEGVSFAYGADVPTVSDITFRLAPGEVLGLIGRTGSGKTTLTRLLFRLYEPTAGAIRLGGVPLTEARLDHLRERVALVTQDIQLFHAPVRDNLTFFDRSIPDAAILDTLRDLGLWDWYEALPNGLDTRLKAGGGGLSAGQAQLLALARVFLRDPGIVVLDEASSRLDPATEQQLERAISRLLAARTAIIIAHRLATVERADRVLILDAGRVVEFGPRTALAGDAASRLAEMMQAGLAAEGAAA